ncbi:helix-turn-helix transcriptional regulator [Marinobacterium weihaiense]|uniref:AlpA family phage regulatory protein n=1 Tax=Marinobacterium weihaiense TaxID=2851016 RepID=A0ABS6M6X2_9GAMM|nr:AlpA family phage regulatory protein [Marinobacterium weihaiense]
MNSTPQIELLRTKQAAAYIGVSRTGLWRLEQTDPTFPRKIVLSSRCVGWRKSSLDAWMASKEGAA